jgi:hypothetical protein
VHAKSENSRRRSPYIGALPRSVLDERCVAWR